MKPKILFTISIFVLLAATLACQATAPIVAIFATDTPTPTSTPSPTPTPTSTSTPSPTPTITPTATPTPEASAEQLADGQTKFTDLKGQFSMTFPNGWWVINLAVGDPQKAIAEAQNTRPEMTAQLESLKLILGLNPRVLAFDITGTDGQQFNIAIIRGFGELW